MKQCTIVIRDELNIKIEGLDLDCRKALVTAFKYENPAARYLPAVRLRTALAAAQAVSTAEIAARAQADGLSGPQIGARIHAARVAAVTRTPGIFG